MPCPAPTAGRNGAARTPAWPPPWPTNGVACRSSRALAAQGLRPPPGALRCLRWTLAGRACYNRARRTSVGRPTLDHWLVFLLGLLTGAGLVGAMVGWLLRDRKR